MNNLGEQSISAGMQAMELPVREIKTKKTFEPKVTPVKPVNFIPTTPAVKKELPGHIDIETPVLKQDNIIESAQPETVVPDTYVSSADIRAAKETTKRNRRKRFAQTDNKRATKKLLQAGIDTRKKTKKEKQKEMQTDFFNQIMFLQSLFIVFYYMYLFNKQYNLYALVAEYETKPDLSQRALDDAMNAWSKPVVVHYDFPIIPIAEENFDKKAKQKNLKALVKKYEIDSRNNARKKHADYVNAMATEAYIKSYDAQLEEDYACWEVNRDMLNFFHDFWEKEAAEYEQMVMPKTIAYKQELIAATTPKTRKYKKKNPNKKKHDNFCLAAGRLPERRVPKKADYKPALKQMRAMFNNAQTSIRNYSNPEHVM